jgi:hypothetical protein
MVFPPSYSSLDSHVQKFSIALWLRDSLPYSIVVPFSSLCGFSVTFQDAIIMDGLINQALVQRLCV